MVFSSAPVYLDPPNWNHQQPQNNHPLVSLEVIPEPHHHQIPSETCMSGSSAAIRTNSMAERARMAKLPQPEQALKCPRCESTNTKFCYFNNYSLSQPRHFCKACRRYWTRGGALRTVPVGGGCRRNKRNKSTGSSSKSTTTTTNNSQTITGASSSSSAATGGGLGTIHSNIPALSQLSFMSSLHTLAHDYGHGSNLGHGFSGIHHTLDVELGNTSSLGIEQWRIPQMQQFPFMGGLEPPQAVQPLSGLYAFDHGDGFASAQVIIPKASSSALITQMASVKMEDSSAQGFSLPRQYLGLHGRDHLWGGNGGASTNTNGGWINANFSSSTSSNVL